MKSSNIVLPGRKTLVWLLLFVAALWILAGCGGRRAEAPAEEQPVAEAPSSEAAAVTEEKEEVESESPEGERAERVSTEGVSGEELFRTYCAKCHGLKGLGDGPSVGSLRTQGGMNLTILQDRSDEEIFMTITAGKGSEMPPWGLVLTEEERWALVEYIRTLGGQ